MRDAASHSRERFVGNPLNSFLLIKKLTSEWKEVQGLIQSGPGERLLHNITLERQNIGLRWPSDEDLNGAAVGEISQLQRSAPRLFLPFLAHELEAKKHREQLVRLKVKAPSAKEKTENSRFCLPLPHHTGNPVRYLYINFIFT
jgi:hypothetical protein